MAPTIVPSAEIPLLVAKLIEGVQPDGETSKDHWHGSPNQVLGRVYVSYRVTLTEISAIPRKLGRCGRARLRDRRAGLRSLIRADGH